MKGKQPQGRTLRAGAAWWVLTLAFLLLVASIAAAQADSDETTLISRQSAADGGAGGDAWSTEPSISADGRYVAFASRAPNLGVKDEGLEDNPNRFELPGVLLRDTKTNTTTLVSRQSAFVLEGARTAHINAYPSISADGRHVAFTSASHHLTPKDNGHGLNVFVGDTQAKTTKLISGPSGGQRTANVRCQSFDPSISADGRYVAFTSSPYRVNGKKGKRKHRDVFLRDTKTNTTTLVSRQSAADGGAGADSHSWDPSISADGRYVAFESGARNLSRNDESEDWNVFLRDTKTNTTTLVSRQSTRDGGAGADGESGGASISADGRYVAFASGAKNLSRNDENGDSDVFVRDTKTNTTTLVSRQSAADGGAGGDSLSGGASISADGQYVAFASIAKNLSAADNDATVDVFLRRVHTYTGASQAQVRRQSHAAKSPVVRRDPCQGPVR